LLDWSRESGVQVVSGYAYENGVVRNLSADDNLHAEEVLIVVER
jgi:hypothetical protein